MGSKQRLISHYDERYRFNETDWSIPVKVKVKKYPKDRYEAAVYWGRGSGRALEIGGGSGIVANTLKNYYDEYVITELSQERVKFLKTVFSVDKKVKIVQDDIEEGEGGFSLEYFDTIIMISIIEHLIEPISAMKYCYSLLKPKGKILVYTPNIAKWTRRLKLLFGFFPSTGSASEGFLTYDGEPVNLHDDGHLHYFTFNAVRRILIENAGFRQVEYCGYGKSFLSRIMPALFSECLVVGRK